MTNVLNVNKTTTTFVPKKTEIARFVTALNKNRRVVATIGETGTRLTVFTLDGFKQRQSHGRRIGTTKKS